MSFTHQSPARTSIAVFGVTLLALLVAWGVWRASDSEAATAAPSEQRLLTFVGTGSAKIAPDGATITAGVSTRGASADAAQDAASKAMRVLIAHMKAAGVGASDLQTADVSVSEDWERRGIFVANQTLTITVDDPARAGELLGEASQGGADTVNGPSFRVEDQRVGYDEAMRVAIADARAKAEAAASQMGAKVLGIYAVGEADSGSSMPMYAMAGATKMTADAVAVPTEQGTQDATMTVRVSFRYER
ncbi:MAG: rane protein [Thermoleophilia bacterium]|nr:rane protein [Thermoleophilia bacterium]